MERELPDVVASVLDVDDLVARCLGNLEFVDRVLAMFHQRCDEDLAELERAADAGDTETVVRLAHRLKGACANASAVTLRARAEEVERAARQGLLDDARERLGNLHDEWNRFVSAVSLLETSP